MRYNNFFKNEDIVQLFLEHAPAAMAMLDMHMHYLAVSKRWMDDYGLDSQDILGLSHYEVFPEISERWKNIYKRGLAGETIHEKNDPFIRADGQIQWLKWEVRPWYTIDSTIGGIIIFTEDITQSMIYEKELQKELMYHQKLIENSNDGIAIVNQNHRIVEVNQRFADMLGYTKDELCKLYTWDFDAIMNESEIRKRLSDLSNIQMILQTQHRRKDGTLYDAEVSIGGTTIDGELIIFTATRDITEQKKLLEVTKLEQIRYKTLMKLASDGIHIFDIEGNLIECSHSFAEMLGYTDSEMSNMTVMDWDVNFTKEILLNDFKKQTEITRIIETKHKRKDGSIIDVQIHVSSINLDGKTYLQAASRDVTKEKEAERKIRSFVNLVDKYVLISTTDLNGIITNVSEAFCTLSGYTKEELIGKSHKMLKHPDVETSVFEDMWNTIIMNKTWEGEIKNRKKDGGSYWTSITISPIYADNNEKIGYTAIRQNITDKKKIEKLSITDPLTGIYNRRYFDSVFPKVINSAKRNGNYICFVMEDIDYFKTYNDTYGHQAGDKVLIDISNNINMHLKRTSDYCFRFGGEEFVIIYECQNENECYNLAKVIHASIDSLKIEHKSSPVKSNITVSMGLVVISPKDTVDIQTVYKQADDMLYLAKKRGRNQIIKFDKDRVSKVD